MDNRPHCCDEDCFVAARSGIQSTGFDPLGDGFGLVGVDILGAWIAAFGSRPRKVPMKIRVGQPGGEPALLAFVARRAIRVLAQQELPQPQGEPLLADPAGTVKEQTRRQRSPRGGGAQLCLQRSVAVQRNQCGGWSGGAWARPSTRNEIL